MEGGEGNERFREEEEMETKGDKLNDFIEKKYYYFSYKRGSHIFLIAILTILTNRKRVVFFCFLTL